MKKPVRLRLEEIERLTLAPYAALSSESRGREREESPCPVRTCFQRDRDRIIHSKAFRRLKHKTQVLLLPEGDHYRTRLTHTLEVCQIARTISRALALNEDLTDAIALGHDLGHTPFGHMGERVLDRISRSRGGPGFAHAAQSLRVVSVLARDGRGLNLTCEVRDGIKRHSKGQVDVSSGFGRGEELTFEAWVVRLADSVAYINHDLDDAFRAGIIDYDDLPDIVRRNLGTSHGERIGSLVEDIVSHSGPEGIAMSEGKLEATEALRSFLYSNVYADERARIEEPKVEHILVALFEHYEKNPGDLPSAAGENTIQKIIDHISGMTDRYALQVFENSFVPSPWPL